MKCVFIGYIPSGRFTRALHELVHISHSLFRSFFVQQMTTSPIEYKIICITFDKMAYVCVCYCVCVCVLLFYALEIVYIGTLALMLFNNITYTQ